MPTHSRVVTVIELIDKNKAKLAFLAPLVTALGAAVVSWVVSGDFNATEVRAAAGGAVLALVSSIATYFTPAGKARVRSESGQSVVGVILAILLAALVYFLCVALGLPSIVGIIAAVLVLLAGFGSAGRF